MMLNKAVQKKFDNVRNKLLLFLSYKDTRLGFLTGNVQTDRWVYTENTRLLQCTNCGLNVIFTLLIQFQFAPISRFTRLDPCTNNINTVQE